MIWSVLSGRRRGTPPVARSSFWYRYTVPRSSVTLRARESSAVIRRPRCSVAPVAAVFRQIFASGSPFLFFFKQKTAYEVGLGIPAEPLFRSAGTSAVSDKLLDLVGLGGKSAADKGKDTRDYLAAAFPELNAWERAGADASSAGMVDAGFENQKELTKMQLDNQKEIAEMQN